MITTVMDRFKLPEDMPIEAKMVSKAIERAQSQVEGQNFEIRKNVLKYDEVMNKQREVVYGERRALLEGADMEEQSLQFVADVIESTLATYANEEAHSEDWDWPGLEAAVTQLYPSKLAGALDHEKTSWEELLEKYLEEGAAYYHRREEEVGPERFRELERLVFLSILDAKWREHLYEMDHLREGIGLRAYGQRDPLVEYQREAYDTFQHMMGAIKEEFVRYMFHVQVVEQAPAPKAPERVTVSHAPAPSPLTGGGDGNGGGSELSHQTGEPARSDKVPRNAPCPCGSGKKYKKCHGAEV
jgi:preprotein translocase subunit SecA